ncbi:hypothetical protein [Halobacterium wangiae]|uniref:hypothetical protein n=1 Tax=Halobacterium wangiae TaxID=2902623 RepID=UPI001E5AA4C8|nr:hypothetical protein [Halobacterium wangiae]
MEYGALWREWRATAEGALAGVLAFCVGYAATLAVQYDEVRESAAVVDEVAALLGADTGGIFRGVAEWLQPDSVQLVGWFFYGSHYVPLEFHGSVLGSTVRRSVDVQETPVWDSLLVLVPPAVLLATGLLLAARFADERPASSLLTGIRIALGYGVTAVTIVSAVSYSRSVGFAAVTVGPNLVTVALYCTGYALAFGTVGAALYGAYVHGE